MQKKTVYFWLVVLCIGAGAVAALNRDKAVVSRTGYYMDTFFSINAYGWDAKHAVDEAFVEIERIERKYDQRKPSSFLAGLNEKAGFARCGLDPETGRLMSVIDKLWRETDGGFDPTVAPLTELWGFEQFRVNSEFRVPSPGEINRVLLLVGWDKLAFGRGFGSVRFGKPGMRLDFGSLAKGYAVDRAWAILKKHRVKGALINGGNSSIRALGKKPDGKYWRVGISHPRRKTLLGIVDLKPGLALSTSADNQRFFIVNGKRYSHLLNPFTGYPSGLVQQVTVQDVSALNADILSTGIFVLGGGGFSLLQRRGREGVIVDSGGGLSITAGWQKESGMR
ncbi:MAG: FAD:protein FMN transferase [Bacillota bacterium]